jgi:hypothetical protein
MDFFTHVSIYNRFCTSELHVDMLVYGSLIIELARSLSTHIFSLLKVLWHINFYLCTCEVPGRISAIGDMNGQTIPVGNG